MALPAEKEARFLQIELVEKAAKTALVKSFGTVSGTEMWYAGQKIEDVESRYTFYLELMRDLAKGTDGNAFATLKDRSHWKTKPVGIRQFIEDKFYLDMKGVLYPIVLDEIEEMNSGRYVEAVLTGAIGTGKTTIALVSTAYQLYLLSCYRDPHEMFGIDPSSEILIIFQSINATLAKAVDYMRFRTMVERSPYFADNFPFNKDLASELRFPNRIIVKPVSGSDTAAIGQNVIGGIIDEINYMAVIENSKASVDGGTYDQAIAVYNSIARRRKSRFMKFGKLPGILCLVSSKRYPGQFTDKKEEEREKEIKEHGVSTIYVYNKRVWDIKPPGTFTGAWFKVFIGDETRRPRIIEEEEILVDDDVEMVVEVPVEYKHEFESDMMNALREIAGISTLARYPFINNVEAIAASMGDPGIESIFGEEWTDFIDNHLTVYRECFEDPSEPRFVHVDLGLTGDSAGVAIGYVRGFMHVDRGDTKEILPIIRVDGVIEVKPPKNGEIMFEKIRQTLYLLRDLGLNIRWVSFDSWQSVDSIQILRQKGFMTGTMSVDTSMSPYALTKTALYDGRLEMPAHSKLRKELMALELIAKKGKIDHPPNGCHFKDVLVDVVTAEGVFPTRMDSLERYYQYQENPKLSCISHNVVTGEKEISEIKSAFITKEVDELVELILDNGEILLCTPDHEYLLTDGTYKPAQYLTPDDDIQT